MNSGTETEDVEIKTVCSINYRHCTGTYRETGCWERSERRLLNGPRRAQGKEEYQGLWSSEYIATWDTRKMSGIWWYPGKSTYLSEARWHRGNNDFIHWFSSLDFDRFYIVGFGFFQWWLIRKVYPVLDKMLILSGIFFVLKCKTRLLCRTGRWSRGDRSGSWK